MQGQDVAVFRAKNPSWGLKSGTRLLTKLVGTELQLVEEPLIAFDRTADLVVIGTKVYVSDPRRVERLLIDADAVKARAPRVVKSFTQQVTATLSSGSITAIQRGSVRITRISGGGLSA